MLKRKAFLRIARERFSLFFFWIFDFFRNLFRCKCDGKNDTRAEQDRSDIAQEEKREGDRSPKHIENGQCAFKIRADIEHIESFSLQNTAVINKGIQSFGKENKAHKRQRCAQQASFFDLGMTAHQKVDRDHKAAEMEPHCVDIDENVGDEAIGRQ